MLAKLISPRKRQRGTAIATVGRVLPWHQAYTQKKDHLLTRIMQITAYDMTILKWIFVLPPHFGPGTASQTTIFCHSHMCAGSSYGFCAYQPAGVQYKPIYAKKNTRRDFFDRRTDGRRDRRIDRPDFRDIRTHIRMTKLRNLKNVRETQKHLPKGPLLCHITTSNIQPLTAVLTEANYTFSQMGTITV